MDEQQQQLLEEVRQLNNKISELKQSLTVFKKILANPSIAPSVYVDQSSLDNVQNRLLEAEKLKAKTLALIN